MIFADTLIDTLKQWDDQVEGSRITDLPGLVSIGLMQMGSEDLKKEDYDSNSLTYLKNRIEYLQDKEGVFEELLVDGLLCTYSNYFKDQIHKRERHIENNMRLVEHAAKANIDKSFITSTEEKIKFMKSDDYAALSEKELKIWSELMSLKFSEAEREKMSNQIMQEGHSRYKEQMSEEERERFNNIIKKMK